MTALLLLSLAAHAESPLTIKVEEGVAAVELDCGGKKMRETVRDGVAVFPIAPVECEVKLVKSSGKTRYNGTWTCNERGCELSTPPHAAISDAADRINFVLLEGVKSKQLELVCSASGFRTRADVVEHTATFDGVPSEPCHVNFLGGQPAKFNGARAGGSYKCSITGVTAVCSPYQP